jgi:hypothetical protein
MLPGDRYINELERARQTTRLAHRGTEPIRTRWVG